MNNENELSIEELMQICNREESFRSVIISLLESESLIEFDAVIDAAGERLSPGIIPFLNDLREIFADDTVRTVVMRLLNETLTTSQIRGMNFLITAHLDQLRRVELLRNRMYSSARQTIEQYVPAFDELSHFLSHLTNNTNWEKVDHSTLTDQFYNDIREAVTSDPRINGQFLEQLCQSESFRGELEGEIDEYPEVVRILWKMADSLTQAQRYLADIEIEDLLHDIEEQVIDDEYMNGSND